MIKELEIKKGLPWGKDHPFPECIFMQQFGRPNPWTFGVSNGKESRYIEITPDHPAHQFLHEVYIPMIKSFGMVEPEKEQTDPQDAA